MSLYRTRDQRIADESGVDKTLMCCAHGCPNRWSVDPPRACSAHAWADAHHWPAITQQQLDMQADRARAEPPPKAPPLTREQKFAILEKVRSITMGSSNSQPRAWAHKLRERERNGERLSGPQKLAWREVLGVAS